MCSLENLSQGLKISFKYWPKKLPHGAKILLLVFNLCSDQCSAKSEWTWKITKRATKIRALKRKLTEQNHIMWIRSKLINYFSLSKIFCWPFCGYWSNGQWSMIRRQWLNGHKLEQTPGEWGQKSLVCCSPWGCKELDTT